MNSGSVASTRFVKRQLKHSWRFFQSFGKLTPVQLESIPIILQKQNALIISPTASGKTEAVVAPLIERLCEIKNHENKIYIVYVTPTKALVNDIFHRLHEQILEFGIDIDKKTGDDSKINIKSPPHFLITTPESLDSLICRHPVLLDSVVAVILDEIHLLDGTYRGDQLRILVNRLFALNVHAPNVYVISATIADGNSLGGRYIPNDFKIIQVSGKRSINFTFFSDWRELFRIARAELLRKLLIFCNYRRQVELIASRLNTYWTNSVVTHHGQLSKAMRLEAESFMKETRKGICVSTMTLEIGIDIGDIDAVVLAEIPWSLSSLVQRIGRSNRRENTCRVLAFFNNEEERQFLKNMFRLAEQEIMLSDEYKPDLSVIVQQIFSILFQNRQGLAKKHCIDMLTGLANEETLEIIWNHLVQEDLIISKRGIHYPSTHIMDLAEKGKIHSNIPDSGAMKVICDNKEIGEVFAPIDKVFLLSGRVWEVMRIYGQKIYVKPSSSKVAYTTSSRVIEHGAFYRYLPSSLRN